MIVRSLEQWQNIFLFFLHLIFRSLRNQPMFQYSGSRGFVYLMRNNLIFEEIVYHGTFFSITYFILTVNTISERAPSLHMEALRIEICDRHSQGEKKTIVPPNSAVVKQNEEWVVVQRTWKAWTIWFIHHTSFDLLIYALLLSRASVVQFHSKLKASHYLLLYSDIVYFSKDLFFQNILKVVALIWTPAPTSMKLRGQKLPGIIILFKP